MNDPLPPGTPKGCLLCSFTDSLGACVTCPNDGEASWSPLVPTYAPEVALEVVTEAPEAAPAPTSKKSKAPKTTA